MKTIVLDPKKWDRGRADEDEDVMLSGKMGRCCIGFLALDYGLREEQITDVPAIRDLPPEAAKELPSLSHKEWMEFYAINDDPDYADEDRVDKLNEMAEHFGVDFRFALKL